MANPRLKKPNQAITEGNVKLTKTDLPFPTETENAVLKKSGPTESSGREAAARLREKFRTSQAAKELPTPTQSTTFQTKGGTTSAPGREVASVTRAEQNAGTIKKVEPTGFSTKGGTTVDSGRNLASTTRTANKAAAIAAETDYPVVKATSLASRIGQKLKDFLPSEMPSNPIKAVKSGLDANQIAGEAKLAAKAAEKMTLGVGRYKVATKLPKSSVQGAMMGAYLGNAIAGKTHPVAAPVVGGAIGALGGRYARLGLAKAAGATFEGLTKIPLLGRALPVVGPALAVADTAYTTYQAVKEGKNAYDAAKDTADLKEKLRQRFLKGGYKPKVAPPGQSLAASAKEKQRFLEEGYKSPPGQM